MRVCKKKKKIRLIMLPAVGLICFLASAVFSASALSKKHSFADHFSGKGLIGEASRPRKSKDKKWWVNSGGWLQISGGTGKTIIGDLSPDSIWYKIYKDTNPGDTDGGIHPQNIFRLVTEKKWQNESQEAYFKIDKMNFSASENRNESNGILLFNRYKDEDNLYYAGLRVDGYAVIKKKIGGNYHTLDSQRVFKGPDYNSATSPNLLPLGQWIGLRSIVKTTKKGDVQLSLYYKMGLSTGKWKKVASYTDKGKKGDKITDPGSGGIRTDFMDVEFSDYKIAEF